MTHPEVPSGLAADVPNPGQPSAWLQHDETAHGQPAQPCLPLSMIELPLKWLWVRQIGRVQTGSLPDAICTAAL